MKTRITQKQLSKMLKRAAEIKAQVNKLDKEMNDMFWRVGGEADRLGDRHMWLEHLDHPTKEQEKERRELGKHVNKLDRAQDKLGNIF